MVPLCFATNNKHKLREVRELLPAKFELLSLDDIGCDVTLPEEQSTLQGNAHQKAKYVKVHCGVDCLADDTGLEVEQLGGEPGVYSARYAGPDCDDTANCAKLLHELKGKENRAARFRTVICLIREQAVHYFEGLVSGNITEAPRGKNGFGYDPLFVPDGYNLTFAEMSDQRKHQVSHRAIAVRKLADFLILEF